MNVLLFSFSDEYADNLTILRTAKYQAIMYDAVRIKRILILKV